MLTQQWASWVFESTKWVLISFIQLRLLWTRSTEVVGEPLFALAVLTPAHGIQNYHHKPYESCPNNGYGHCGNSREYRHAHGNRCCYRDWHGFWVFGSIPWRINQGTFIKCVSHFRWFWGPCPFSRDGSKNLMFLLDMSIRVLGTKRNRAWLYPLSVWSLGRWFRFLGSRR